MKKTEAGPGRSTTPEHVHRLPLLHHGVPVRRAEVPVGPAGPGRRQVRAVRAARGEGPGDGVRHRVPDRRDDVRRARRADPRGAGADRAGARRATSTTSTGSRRPAAPSVLMLSGVPFAQLGPARQPARSEPLPLLTWQVLSHLPDVVVVAAVVPVRHPLDHRAARAGARRRGRRRRSSRRAGARRRRGTVMSVALDRAAPSDARRLLDGVFFVILFAPVPVRHVHALHARTGRDDEPERPVPVGAVDRLRHPVRRRPRGRGVHAHGDRAHVQHPALRADRAPDGADRLPRLPVRRASR